jgi:hypothetical protein
MRSDDGAYSQMLFSFDGATGEELTQKDLFKMWSMIGMTLAQNGKLKGYQKDMVDIHEDNMRRVMKHMKSEEEKDAT